MIKEPEKHNMDQLAFPLMHQCYKHTVVPEETPEEEV